MNVLIVEDDLLIRLMLTKYLNALGHDVVEACHGEEGLKKIRNGSFDLVITDIMMPVMGGVELAEGIRKIGLQLPVFGLTAASPEIIEKENPGLFKSVYSKTTHLNDILKEVFKNYAPTKP